MEVRSTSAGVDSRITFTLFPSRETHAPGALPFASHWFFFRRWGKWGDELWIICSYHYWAQPAWPATPRSCPCRWCWWCRHRRRPSCSDVLRLSCSSLFPLPSSVEGFTRTCFRAGFCFYYSRADFTFSDLWGLSNQLGWLGSRNLGSRLALASTFSLSTVMVMLMAPLPLLSFSLHTHRHTGRPGRSAVLEGCAQERAQGCIRRYSEMRSIRNLFRSARN